MENLELNSFNDYENKDIVELYKQSHRFYHTIEHIDKMLHSAKEKNILDENLFLSILFHDAIYDPKKQIMKKNQ